MKVQQLKHIIGALKIRWTIRPQHVFVVDYTKALSTDDVSFEVNRIGNSVLGWYSYNHLYFDASNFYSQMQEAFENKKACVIDMPKYLPVNTDIVTRALLDNRSLDWLILGAPLEDAYVFVLWCQPITLGRKGVLPLHPFLRNSFKFKLTRRSPEYKNKDVLSLLRTLLGMPYYCFFQPCFRGDGSLFGFCNPSRFINSVYWTAKRVYFSHSFPPVDEFHMSFSEYVFAQLVSTYHLHDKQKEALKLFDMNNNIFDFGRWLVFADYLADELKDQYAAELLHANLLQIKPYLFE